MDLDRHVWEEWGKKHKTPHGNTSRETATKVHLFVLSYDDQIIYIEKNPNQLCQLQQQQRQSKQHSQVS